MIDWGSRFLLTAALLVHSAGGAAAAAALPQEPGMPALLPEIASWGQSDQAQVFHPENLFEYIDGAAEIYLSYDFHELLVAQFEKSGSESSVSVEIYDMGSPTNAFGIYSAERYPDNSFIPVGTQGYVEEGSLNFLAGRYYVKLLCFDCGEDPEQTLMSFARGIVGHIGDDHGLPELLDAFPREGRLANTEKFILNNVMGYGFLHDGFMASYEVQDQEFDCFVIRGGDEDDAEAMLKKFLEAKGGSAVQRQGDGWRIEDRYYHNIYITRIGRFLGGVMKIRSGFEETGKAYQARLIENLKGRGSQPPAR